MAWNWTKSDVDIGDGRVQRQLNEYGCGAACVVMLLADRGIESDQLAVTSMLHLPSTGREIADCLNGLSRDVHSWQGGHLDLDPPVTRAHLTALGGRGSWAALLIPGDLRRGHWVVVDSVDDDGMIAIRDPVGASYRMPEDEFLGLMRYIVAVFEVGVEQ